MIKKTVTIVNKSGLHARPSAALVKLASSFKSDFYIHMYGYRVNGKSILGVMTLAAEEGAELLFEVSGPDEKEAMVAITELVENKFGSEDE
ncbi:MAG: HPr family phosphocarrier protein [Balneolales bacterium]|nr:HPr family phosphocarrier protein [Balneolales bacterium]